MKYLFFLIAASAMLNASAQTITSFTVDPAIPTTADTVRIFIRCDFQDANCDGTAYLNGISGYEISAGAIHCMGSLTGPCAAYDTVIVPPLAAGNYSLIFILSTGITAGCIPNIIPIVIDSTHFTVSPATGVYDLGNHTKVLQIMPNPSDGKFIVKQSAGENALLKIFSAEGRLLESFPLTGNETEINCSFPPGIYTIMTESKDGRLFSKLVLVK